MKSKRCGFSLIELLVVVAIIAVLAAVATPVYTQYKYRSLIATAYDVIFAIREKAVLGYTTTGSWPSSITFGSNTLPNSSNSGTVYAVNVYPVISANYYAINNVVYVSGTVSGLNGLAANIDGTTYTYSTPAAGNFGNITLIRAASQIVPAGYVQNYCGIWASNDVNSIPLEYQPAICNCTDLDSVFASGTIGGGTGTNDC